MKKSLLSLAVVLALSGCSFIPEYMRPTPPVDQSWPEGEAYANNTGAQAQPVSVGWRDYFLDRELQDVIGLALKNNRDLRVSALNVEAYAAQYRIQRSALFPEIDAAGSGSRQRIPNRISSTGEHMIQSQYGVTVGVTSYELDVWGRIRSLKESALQQYLAAEETQRSTQISLVGAVANAWLTWQADKELLALTKSTLKTYEDSYELVRRSNEVGVASTLDVSQARTAVEGARASLSQYKRQVAQDRNQLVMLLGGDLPVPYQGKGSLGDAYVEQIPVGLPSSVLLQRPDVRAAEHSLLAANASIGAARAAFFPSISLTANGGTLSPDFDGLFDSATGSWLFAPHINLPIFTGGRLKANLDYAEIQKDVNVARYEKTIQSAFQEVSDGLAARSTYKDQVEAQSALVDASQTYYNLADQRYKEGIDNYLTLLDAQRSLFSAQQVLINVRLAQLVTEVNLYKALGGGWDEHSSVSKPVMQKI